jgi:putative transposase
MSTVADLSRHTNTKAACEAFGVPRATFYRQTAVVKRPLPPLALSDSKEHVVLDTLHEPRFYDLTPYHVYLSLLDERIYHFRTMYRVLAKHDEVRERRRHAKRSHYEKPELLATGPNQVWSWGINKSKGPAKWTYFHLYVILYIFSRYVVGWMVAHREHVHVSRTSYQRHLQKTVCSAGSVNATC